jgi:biotin synthase
MFSISPFTPHPSTPLAACRPYAPTGALRLMALARIAMPKAHIPVTSALGLYGDAMRLAGLQTGNVLMLSFTPQGLREAYSIYAGKNIGGAAPVERARAVCDMLLASGFSLPAGPGGAWRLGGQGEYKLAAGGHGDTHAH